MDKQQLHLGIELFDDYEVEDILSGAALDAWNTGLILVYENYRTNYVLFCGAPNDTMYIPMYSGTGKYIRILKDG